MAKGRGGFIGQDGLNAPDSPTGVSASAGNTQATVSFTAPTDVGGSAITGYRAQSNDGIGASGSSSPITVTGLTNGTSYTFNVWAINASGYSAPSDASGSVSPVSPRGIFFAGQGTSGSNVIDYITISSTGNATDFGDLDQNRENFRGALGSSTRGVVGGGATSPSDLIQYITIASTGNASTFGDLLTTTTQGSGVSNETRGLFCNGNAGADSNVIEYITIASTGNSTDFGDSTQARVLPASAGNTTRAVMAGGRVGGSPFTRYNIMDYVTIASTGNASDFGDLTVARDSLAGCSSSTRAVFGGGYVSSAKDEIDYVTTASTGNATDFGNLSTGTSNLMAASSKTRGTFAGGYDGGGVSNRIEYITIANTGNSTDFGDLTLARYEGAGCSNVHGGLA